MVMVSEGPARQAVSLGQSSETGLGLMWVYQWLEHSIRVALWALISRVPTMAIMCDRGRIRSSKARQWAEALKGPMWPAAFQGQSSSWGLGRMWLRRLRQLVMVLMEDRW